MVRLVHGETLEVGGLAFVGERDIAVRAFEVVDGDANLSFTHVALRRGEDWALLRTFDAEIVDIQRSPQGDLVCMEANGRLHLYRDDSWSEVAPPIGDGVRVSTLRLLSGRTFALGPSDRLLELQTRAWRQLGTPAGGHTYLGIAVDPAAGLLVCGTDGLFLAGDGDRFSRIDLPTNVHLTDLLVAKDSVFVSGHASTLARRDGGAWAFVDAEGRTDDFLRLCLFRGEVLIAADVEILRVTDDGLVIFAEIESQDLVAHGERLLSNGLDDAMLFDGTDWEPLSISFDVPDAGPFTARRKV